MSYRRRASPLHAARAGAGCLYCLALAVAALVLDHPLELAAVTLGVLAGGAAAGVGRELRRAARFAVPLALIITLVNALVSRDGLHVIVRLGELPIVGHTDITLEATAYGAMLGLRAVAFILCGALYTAAVDPDEVLRLFRRISFRSALTATLATRMVPVLLRDAHRLADAQRCRPGPPPSRFALVRAAGTGALDRALDVAAALEVRGYGGASAPARSARPYSRQDLAFGGSALALIVVSVGARAIDLTPFHAYPSLRGSIGLPECLLAAVVLAVSLLPFTARRGAGR